MDLYDIPVIQPDLRHEETIIQVANALDFLQQVIAEVFDKVDDRISRNVKAIQDIDARIDKVNKKIDAFSNDYESIEIQSPCVYPPDKLFKDIPMTLTLPNHKEINVNRNYQIQSAPDGNISKTYDKKLQFYYVRQSKNSSSSCGSASSKDVHTYVESGFASIPSHIDSVNALLLFNKSENVYDKKTQKKLRRFEPFEACYYDPVLSDGPGDIEKAPASIATRQLLNMRKKNLFMSTQWNDDEQIDIPIMLPDVGGIRDKNKKNTKIMESQDENLMLKVSDEPKLVQNKSVPADTISKIKTQNTEVKSSTESSSSVVDSAPTPPPVPPPMEIPATPKVQPPKLNSNTQDRSALMEAIRQAGGAQKMKKKLDFEESESQEKSEKEKKPVTFSSGSLMDDLHKKLALRRKGISGNKDQGSNVMDGISAMIPPPPPKQLDYSSESESNDDWN